MKTQRKKLHNKDTNNSIAGNRNWDAAVGYVPLISQNPYPIMVYSVPNIDPILVTFEKM